MKAVDVLAMKEEEAAPSAEGEVQMIGAAQGGRTLREWLEFDLIGVH